MVPVRRVNISYFEQPADPQRSSSGAEMSFRSMHLSDQFKREDSFSFSQSSKIQGSSRLQQENVTGFTSDLRCDFNAVNDRDYSHMEGASAGR